MPKLGIGWLLALPLRAVLASDLSMPHLVDVVAHIIVVWPLIVSYIKDIEEKDNGDSPVVGASFFYSI